MPRTDRVYLRISPELKQKMRAYCVRRHTSLSELVTRFLVRLLEEEQRKKVIDAEQI